MAQLCSCCCCLLSVLPPPPQPQHPPRGMGVGGRDVWMGGGMGGSAHSSHRSPSFVLGTVCGLRGARRCPRVLCRFSCPAAGSIPHGTRSVHPAVPPASRAGSGCRNVPLVSGDRFCSPDSIFLSACSLLRLGAFPSDLLLAELREHWEPVHGLNLLGRAWQSTKIPPSFQLGPGSPAHAQVFRLGPKMPNPLPSPFQEPEPPRYPCAWQPERSFCCLFKTI